MLNLLFQAAEETICSDPTTTPLTWWVRSTVGIQSAIIVILTQSEGLMLPKGHNSAGSEVAAILFVLADRIISYRTILETFSINLGSSWPVTVKLGITLLSAPTFQPGTATSAQSIISSQCWTTKASLLTKAQE